ncbi:hypothetical protein F5X98DRAFT_368810 [Xylaria grammica]|nr:hypothetical protein F5X98DRAFT_368810 [Xylaria grammica]
MLSFLYTPPGSITTTWYHKLRFIERPSPESKAEHAIVIAYYNTRKSPLVANKSGIPDFDESISTRVAPFHIRHCFDYLRQALTGAADTNLDVLHRQTHLANSWGQPRLCRDCRRVFAFAKAYANL